MTSGIIHQQTHGFDLANGGMNLLPCLRGFVPCITQRSVAMLVAVYAAVRVPFLMR